MTTSCQYFETKKVSLETFYKEELKTIDWKDVDQYPAFPKCESFTEKREQKSCFENTLSSHLRQVFINHNAIAVRDLNDTVIVKFTISNIGKLSILEIQKTETINTEFPTFNHWLEESIDTLNPVSPAYKRGIPVETQFTLPIIIKTSS